MDKTAIIIPSRLNAQRLPNKPLKLIDNKEMILHVYESAINSKSGEVYIATPDQKIIDVVKNIGGNVIKTLEKHATGTDRVYEVFKNVLNNQPNIIVNLQGDMPNILPQAISSLVAYMKQGKCDIGTLASKFNSKDEIKNPNVVKVAVKDKLLENTFVSALDFFRKGESLSNTLYHHVGIYAFTSKALRRYVSLKRSKLEIKRKLEQMRALENSMTIHVGYLKASPLSVDTEEDLIEIKKIMENKK